MNCELGQIKVLLALRIASIAPFFLQMINIIEIFESEKIAAQPDPKWDLSVRRKGRGAKEEHRLTDCPIKIAPAKKRRWKKSKHARTLTRQAGQTLKESDVAASASLLCNVGLIKRRRPILFMSSLSLTLHAGRSSRIGTENWTTLIYCTDTVLV